MAGLTDKLRTLNNADLSGLAARIDALRAKLAKDLIAQGENPNRPITAADLAAASQKTGLSVEELIEALETAQRRGLI